MVSPLSVQMFDFQIHLGALSSCWVVLQGPNRNGLPVWRRIFTQGLLWWQAQVTLTSDPNDPVTNVLVQGVAGDGSNGDIVIDDIDITTGACSKIFCYIVHCYML